MTGLPAEWLGQLEQARRGLALGDGPWWDGRLSPGQALFAVPDTSFSGPAGALAVIFGAKLWLFFHALVLSAGVAVWLRRLPKEQGLAQAVVAPIAMLSVAGALLHPEAAALLGAWAWLPWAVMLSADGRGALAAPVCALLFTGGSPLVALLGLGWSRVQMESARAWAMAWGLGALMAAPVLLEAARLAPAMAGRPQPLGLAMLGGPLMTFQVAVVCGLGLLLVGRWIRGQAGLVLGLGLGLIALGAPMFTAKGSDGWGAAAATQMESAGGLMALGAHPKFWFFGLLLALLGFFGFAWGWKQAQVR